jgi:endoglucanase
MITINGKKVTLKSNFFCTMLLPVFLITMVYVTPAQSSYLHSKGSKLYNDKEQVVRLTGANWFGFETTNFIPHGLWARDYHGMLLQVKSMGFNCLRLPFCNDMLRDGATNSVNSYGTDSFYPRAQESLNKELVGLTPIQTLDEIIRYAGEIGLVIILDNHSRKHDAYMEEKLWYAASCSETQWIDDWVMIANRYKNNPTVVGFDLNNEPHGKTQDGGATWATGNLTNDWDVAAQKCGNAILAVNPDVLIIIEGVEQYESTVYWWGGNLRGVKKNPIVLSKPEKLLYSAHEYGPEVFQQPWFEEAGFPGNLEAIWDDAFGFVVKDNIAPLLIGEFGIGNKTSFEGRSWTWFTTFLEYMADNLYSWTFWSLNPNSGDTGGLLAYDWLTVEQWKLDALKPLCAPLINEPTSTKSAVIRKDQNSKLLSISNNQITCKIKGPGSMKVDIVNLSGRVIRSSAKFPFALQLPVTGIYTAVLYKNSQMIETKRFTVN